MTLRSGYVFTVYLGWQRHKNYRGFIKTQETQVKPGRKQVSGVLARTCVRNTEVDIHSNRYPVQDPDNILLLLLVA